jgi:hypothetical protein
MKIDVSTHTIIKIHSTYDTVDELPQIEELYLAVLSKVFLNKPALIITIAPDKKYSIGYEIGSFQELKIDKSTFLINDFKSCSHSILTEISRSEEFGRGLLLLLTRDNNLLENLEESLRCIHNKISIENLSYETVVCENDGRTLSLYNTALTEETLFHKFQKHS